MPGRGPIAACETRAPRVGRTEDGRLRRDKRKAPDVTVGNTPGDAAELDDTPFPAFREGCIPSEDEVRLADRKLAVLADRDETDPLDFTEAVAWFGRAAGLGSVSAQATLGEIHEFGYGVEPDMAAAIGWYRMAAGRGSLKAQMLLADLYSDELSEWRSYRKARKWLRKAARQGNVTAQTELGFLYHEGRGGRRRRRKAVILMTRAADGGAARAQLFLGDVYATGKTLPRDPAVAAAWYRRAAEAGEARAQYQLGVMFSEGDGVERDAVQAFALLDLASQDRYTYTADARARRDELERAMTPSELREAAAARRELEARIGSK